MNEYQIGYLAVGSLISVAISSALYMAGGRNNKIIRRLGSALVLGLTVNIICVIRGIWSPWFLLCLPMLFGGFSMGYGANELYIKIARRLLYAIAVCASGLVFCLVLGGNAWAVLPFHLGVAAWSIYLGTRNPIAAAAEEVFICTILNLGLIAYPFI